MKGFKRFMFIFGLGIVYAYYGLTCLMYIMAFLTHSPTVIIHLNLFGEMSMEVLLTILSLPCSIYAIKVIRESINHET